MSGSTKTAALMMVLAVAVVVAVVPQFEVMHQAEAIKKGAGVTAIKLLSDYFPALKGSPGTRRSTCWRAPSRGVRYWSWGVRIPMNRPASSQPFC